MLAVKFMFCNEWEVRANLYEKEKSRPGALQVETGA